MLTLEKRQMRTRMSLKRTKTNQNPDNKRKGEKKMSRKYKFTCKECHFSFNDPKITQYGEWCPKCGLGIEVNKK